MVTVPRLQRISPSTSGVRSPRIGGQAPDLSSSILQRGEALASLGKRAIEVNRAYEDNKIDNLSSEAGQKYAEWNAQKLGQLKAHQGDPTDAYAQYDIEEKEFLEGLLADKPDLNDRVSRGLTNNLTKLQNKNRVKVLKQRGYQKEVYEHNLFNADVKLTKNELAISASYIEKGDRTSNLKFDQGLDDIKTLVAKNGVRTGTVTELEADSKEKGDHRYEDADGNLIKVKYSPMAANQVYKEMNEGVVNSVDVLIASGKTAEARNLMEGYSKFIDSKSKAKFEKRLKVNEDESKARDFLGSIRGKTEEEQTTLIDGIKDSEVRSEALKIKHLDSTRLKALRKRSEDKNFERVHSVVEKLRESGQLYTEKSITDHPEIKMILQKASLNPKQMRTLTEEFKSPKVSDAKAEQRITDILLGDHPTLKVGSMTSAQIAEASVGLSAGEKSKFRTKVLARQTEGGTVERTSQIYNRASKLLTESLYAKELIKNNKFGKLEGEDFLINKKARLELIEYLDNQDLGAKPSMAEINKHIEGFIVQKKKEKLFGGGSWFDFSSDAPPPKAKVSKDPLEGLSQTEIFRFQRDYKKANGNIPKVNDTAFLNYVRENK